MAETAKAKVFVRNWSPGLRCLLLGLIVGCGSGGSPRLPLQGQVSFNGEPIADGSISLLPLGDTPGAPVMGLIKDGQYNIPVPEGPSVGSYRVDIEGYRKTGRQIPDMASPLEPGEQRGMIDEKLPYIPPKFNSNSTLTAEVTHETETLDFDLKP